MPRPVTVLVDAFPVLSETFVANEVGALIGLGHAVRIEAGVRGEDPARVDLPVPAVLAEDGRGDRLRALLWLAARHPWRCVRDAVLRRRLGREETPRRLRELAPAARRIARAGSRHLHAHFAAGAALDALRLGGLLGLPYSVTAHAYDIYAQPRNLRRKLEGAVFATSGCRYTVADLRAIAPGASVHEIVMGVDTAQFAASRPAPGCRRVVAVGRLVEKKGFADLIDAAAALRGTPDALDAVTIVGDGPLRAALATRIAEHGADDLVELAGARSPDGVRAALLDADVLAAPCVVTADGDRDSAPLVVKEALAMGRLVVASDEVGLPEFVRAPWGRLHRPGDAPALAEALARTLAMTVDERVRAGRAGRAFVAEHAEVHRESAKLSALIDQRS